MTDDLTRMRARKIARTRTTDEIRASIRAFQESCPNCGVPLNVHDSAALDRCALDLGAGPRPA